jgi:hypothetical protein
MRDRTAGDTREHETGGGAEYADLERVGDACLRREHRCPCDRSAVAAEERHAAGKQSQRKGTAKQRRRPDTQ